MKKLHVAISPLTDRIYCGGVLKDGITWAANKEDVTGEACAAVAKHVLANGHPTVITANGVPAFEITVRDLRTNEPAHSRTAGASSGAHCSARADGER